MKPIVAFIFVVLVATGWGLNLMKLAESDFEPPYKSEVIRVVGIFPIVGAVTGWLTIGDEDTKDTKDN